MLVRLTSGLHTKNHLGISQEILNDLVLDKKFNYLRSQPFSFDVEKKNDIMAFPTLELNVHTDYMALVIPNPELSQYGVVWGNQIAAGECMPVIYFKAHKACDVELDYLYEIRLIK